MATEALMDAEYITEMKKAWLNLDAVRNRYEQQAAQYCGCFPPAQEYHFLADRLTVQMFDLRRSIQQAEAVLGQQVAAMEAEAV